MKEQSLRMKRVLGNPMYHNELLLHLILFCYAMLSLKEIQRSSSNEIRWVKKDTDLATFATVPFHSYETFDRNFKAER